MVKWKEIDWKFIFSLGTNIGLSIIILLMLPVTLEYKKTLDNCFEEFITFYSPRRYCALICDNNITTFNDTGYVKDLNITRQTLVSIYYKIPDLQTTEIMSCQKTSFNLSEWIRCSPYIQGTP